MIGQCDVIHHSDASEILVVHSSVAKLHADSPCNHICSSRLHSQPSRFDCLLHLRFVDEDAAGTNSIKSMFAFIPH